MQTDKEVTGKHAEINDILAVFYWSGQFWLRAVFGVKLL
jgi:hypothetical protein